MKYDGLRSKSYLTLREGVSVELDSGIVAVALPPVMSREAWATAIGLEIGVVNAQCDKGYWPCVRVGKYSLINCEAVRAAALEKGREFVL